MTTENQSFESIFLELEKIAKSLKSGELTLDESMKTFKKGIELYEKCNKILEEAKQQIEIFER